MIKSIFVVATATVLLGLSLLVLLLPTTENTTARSSSMRISDTNQYLIQQASVFDGKQFNAPLDIRIANGVITKMAPHIEPFNNEKIIDATDMTILPGLIDAHTHTFGAGLRDTLRFGVTSHLDMFTAETLLAQTRQQRQQFGPTNQADLYSSGTLATVTGGHGTQYGFYIPTIDQLSDIPEWINQRKQAGADYIKLVYIPNQSYKPSLSLTQAQEVIRLGHANGLKVLAHISTLAAAKDMIQAGIDGLVHIFADQVADQAVIELAQQQQVFIIPTLAVIASVSDQQLNSQLANQPRILARLSSAQLDTLTARFGEPSPGFDFAIALENVRLFYQAGIPILAGSDAPNSGTAYGVSTHHEIQLLTQAGLSTSDALAAATAIPAQQFDLALRGKIQINYRADLLLVAGDPENNINDTLNIQHIFKNGYAVSLP